MTVKSLTGSALIHSTDHPHKTAANKHTNQEKQPTVSVNEEEAANKEKVISMVDELNEMAKPLRTNLNFQLHEKLDEYYVEVVNPLTGEVIKEIPPKKMLDRYAAMAEFMGILVDEKI